MNLLENVKNGQHFCLKAFPSKIYKRIHNLVKAEGHKKLVVQCRSLSTGKLIDVEDPHQVQVIPLGKVK